MIGVGLSTTGALPVLRRATRLRRAAGGAVFVLSIGAWKPRVMRQANGNVVVS